MMNNSNCLKGCFVIPSYILTNIVDHPSAPESAKVHARNALVFTRDCHQRRDELIAQRLNASQAEVQGIIPGHILANIVSSEVANTHARNAAQNSLVISGVIRDQREAQAASLRPKAAAPKRLNRMIYSADNTDIPDNTLLRSEGGPATSDPAAEECYDGFGSTFKFYADVFDRNSINDGGMTLTGTIHFKNAYSNAQWDGAQMIFGDGDGTYFNRFTTSLDVIGHELTHGVTQYTANLIYRGLPGALNESMSDVFGVMVKQYQLGQTSAQADWLIGAELWTPNVKGIALRSMKAPGTAYDDPVLGKDRQTASYAEVLSTAYPDSFDHGGVHIYSGVPNRAFYLIAIQLGGHSWDRAGRIWWAVLSGGQLQPDADFHDFAKLTCEAAQSLYGSSVKTVVETAWREVGVEVGGQPDSVPQPKQEPSTTPS
ncbi:hypothetical protein BXZ70DRAFT_769210 [Cristinia sonorae]|uniref:Neutral metalloproteinase n=1 Tax=Cristinia sonorae TaxID=1940300 RepID=A0A8K0XS07_9AGAR|nr:hypothetical protein BXZ70DRAFT_769210 [Cristinia sonorae]